MRKLSYKIIVTVMCAIAFLHVQTVSAQNAVANEQRAVNAYNAGLDAKDRGDNEAACRHFNAAAVLWENAIYGLAGANMSTQEARDSVKAVADNLQARADKAKSKAREVCGKSN